MRVVRVSAIHLFLLGCLVLANGCTSGGRDAFVTSEDSKLQQQVAELESLLSKKQEQIEQLQEQVKAVEGELRMLQEENSALKLLISTEVKIKGRLEIAVGEKAEIIAEISPVSAVLLVSFGIEDPNIATVEPRSASSSSQTLQVAGVKQGETRLIARVGGRLCAEATVKIQSVSMLIKAERVLKSRFGAPFLLLGTTVLFLLAYFIYGRFLVKRYEIDDSRPTPSHTDYDNVDRVPAHRAILLGHHFSSIAGAGPIVGPVIAALAFGWAPVLGWIILGSIFIGGVHDFSALIASVRHKARSIAEIAREYMSPLAWKLFLAFIWFSLVYVLSVFADLTAASFVENGGVATSSLLFIVLAIGFGISIYRLKIGIVPASLIFVPLVFFSVWLGQQMPIQTETINSVVGWDPKKVWSVLLIIYCFLASTLPVWFLLQPRDYLSSFLLYGSVLGGFAGILFGGIQINYPAFKAWDSAELGTLFPMLFITVACGACSGFHSLVASGTSSKQIDKESDAKFIGYGAMLVEGIVAVIALATVIMLAKSDPLTKKVPLVIYGEGMGRFLSVFGASHAFGVSFGLLALSTFVLTTLDTATRLGRYVFEEFFGLKGGSARYLSTLGTLAMPAFLVMITLKDQAGNPIPAWKAIWPVFGATNQLLAGLVLLVVAVWLKKTGRKTGFVLGPMFFMNVMTIWALVLLLLRYKFSAVGIIAAVLLLLAVILVIEACKTIKKVIFV